MKCCLPPFLLATIAAGAAFSQSPDLPERVGVPEILREKEKATPAEELPLPAPRPSEGRIIPPEEMPEMDEPHAPAPDARRSDDSEKDAGEGAAPEKDAMRPTEGTIVPPEEMACRARLTALGIRFQMRPPELDHPDCPLPFPVSMETLGAGIAIEPAALVNCATAEATARFAQEHVAPLASELLGSGLATVRQVSGYVCRPRRGTDTISEHATGNAIDFGGFVLEDGREIAASKTRDVKVGRFFARLRHAACGPFKTVLGPGTDADHADHFHFDLAERRNGSTYCR